MNIINTQRNNIRFLPGTTTFKFDDETFIPEWLSRQVGIQHVCKPFSQSVSCSQSQADSFNQAMQFSLGASHNVEGIHTLNCSHANCFQLNTNAKALCFY